MPIWEFILTDNNEMMQLTDKLYKEEMARQEIWKELKEEGKTDKEILEIFLNFGL